MATPFYNTLTYIPRPCGREVVQSCLVYVASIHVQILLIARFANTGNTEITENRVAGHGGSDGLHGYVESLDHVVADAV